MSEDNNNIGETEQEASISEFEKKIKNLLNELDSHLEKIGDNYGPILMDELQNRLQNVVKLFNTEVNEIFTESFKKWKVTDTQLRDFVKNDIKIPEKKVSSKKIKGSKTPKFIKDVDFGPIKPK